VNCFAILRGWQIGDCADTKALRALRWNDFRCRADYNPEAVYRHRTLGWEYIPVHPFGDELAHLARLGIEPEHCWGVDAWWSVNRDATLLETSIARVSPYRPGLYARKTEQQEGWVYLRVVFELPFITRQAFEAAMTQLTALGFPDAKLFDLQPEHGAVWLADVLPRESPPSFHLT